MEERSIGGPGLHFVREMMDRFSYRRADGRNIVTLTEDISDAGAGGWKPARIAPRATSRRVVGSRLRGRDCRWRSSRIPPPNIADAPATPAMRYGCGCGIPAVRRPREMLALRSRDPGGSSDEHRLDDVTDEAVDAAYVQRRVDDWEPDFRNSARDSVNPKSGS